MHFVRFAVTSLFLAAGMSILIPAGASEPMGRQSPCVYELLSLDVSSEHYLRLLNKCAPKGTADSLLLVALTRRSSLKSTPAAKSGLSFSVLAAQLTSFFTSIWWLTWPLTVLAFAVVASAIVNPLAKHVWRRESPKSIPVGADMVIARNLTQNLATSEKDDAEVSAGTLWQAFPGNPRQAMSVDHNVAADLEVARDGLSAYFECVYAAMLSSQMRAVGRLKWNGQSTLADIQSYYDAAVEKGAGISLRDWFDYLDRFRLVRQATAIGGAQMNAVSITLLGRLFTGWCDANSYMPTTLEISGRPF
jgi:hypothetical protein